MTEITSLLLFGGGVILYFLPAFLAHGKRNATAIFLLNLFLGWTCLGWIAALVWAAMKDEPTRNP